MSMSFEESLAKYAALAVEVGVNVQPNQLLVVTAPLAAVDFVRAVVKRAYDIGAKFVHVEWIDEEVTRTRYERANDDSFSYYPQWRARGWEEMAEQNAAFLSISAADPDLLNGIDPARIKAATIASSSAMQGFRSYAMSDKVSWSVVATPSQGWADKVFAELPSDERIPALWQSIFRATRVDQPDPVQAWRTHTALLDDKASVLNNRQYASLHYTAPGTDLTIALPHDHIWVSAGSLNAQGTEFVANMPTEEVFTAPLKTGVNGTVSSTKPLSYGGNLIEGIRLTFKDGQIVDFQADRGYDALKTLIETDEGSSFLGEVALVPYQSPISQTNLIFYNTLFDENASCHLAIGKAYAFCLKGGKTMNTEEQKERGLNDSLAHVDFMIGSPEMNIDGILNDGTSEPLFRNGNWAF